MASTDILYIVPVDADGEGKGLQIPRTVGAMITEDAPAATETESGTVLQAAFVANADDSSLATLAADIDELRDSLIAAGIMAAS